MYIVYEYAACALAVTTGAMMLFAAYVTSVLLIEGGRFLAQTLRKPGEGPLSAARQTDGG